jgi:hypothetical protein
MNRKARRWLLFLPAILLGFTGCQSVGGAKEYQPVLSKFETNPPGASVFVEGGFVATTPASFYLPAKPRVSIRLEMVGYLPVEEVLVRAKGTPEGAEEGAGWEELYFWELYGK